MAAKRFQSKVDAWLAVLMAIALIGVMTSFAAVAIGSRDPWLTLGVGASMLLVAALILSTLLRTYYSIEGDTLKVVSGPFRWRVPISEISSLEATRSPWSSPALSMDRLRVRYSGNRCILISPRDKERFAKAIGMSVTN